ncbi:RNA 2',3'-cyclic phosphodiesterase [Kutzneria viridogrisea]|uniref:RNA 2',3'-cyclic phosphodiesterase n=2 Tax=Kutzneria TaxID=43356 RepID=W5WI68_9PSEU|nr:2'-5' RNA ligase family protein [Kutzneria albida]AHI00553.1 hypothetical protein KALB_7195 [Kutzneria albida DSM 43870]MBA8925732.1 2'-5' RNA ligase [Kutzneria viridogrisea]
MTRLFTALVPDAPVLDHLVRAVTAVRGDRHTSIDKWHVTLCFHGDGDDPVARTGWVRERLAGLAAPRIRLRSAAAFPGVLWIGVQDPDGTLAAAAEAVRWHAEGHVEHRAFTPHLTIARERHGELDPAPLIDYEGPWWTAGEAVLFASERVGGGYRYEPLDRVRFTAR